MSKRKNTAQLIFHYQVLREIVDDLQALIEEYRIQDQEIELLNEAKQSLITEMKIIFELLEKENIHPYGTQRDRLRKKQV